MTITAVDHSNEISLTIKDVSKISMANGKVTYEKPNKKYYVFANGEIIAVTENSTLALMLFRTLSSKIDTDSHYMIIKEPADSGFTVEGFNPGKIL